LKGVFAMIGLNSSLYIARDALMTQQLAISVTGQNIANVNTTGYSRQRVNLESKVIVTSDGPMGAGVIDQGVVRIYDQFLNVNIQGEIQQKGRWQAENQSMQQVEIIFDESSEDGLSQHMSQFWNSWQDLTLNPSGYAERKSLVTASEDMASNFQEKYQYLDQVQADMDDRIIATTDEINNLASQISDLNDKIVKLEINGASANDFRDQRDVLINQLSEKINLSTAEDSDGRVTITLGDGGVGNELVGNSPARQLTTVENTTSGYLDVAWADTAEVISITDGNIRGWMNVRDTLVPEYKDQLDFLAGQIIDRVNAVHAAGQGLDGSIGNDFFIGESASTIAVNPDIVDNVNLIAAASGSVSPELIRGDNSQALAIAGLQNNLTMDSGSATFDTYYNSLVSRVGSDVLNASSNLEHHTLTVDQMENYRESISGVSLDEEMVNLVKYQQGYSAAAKLIDTVRQMMDTVIGLV
jgi:flagellar hook-associated protein 1 FlgK